MLINDLFPANQCLDRQLATSKLIEDQVPRHFLRYLEKYIKFGCSRSLIRKCPGSGDDAIFKVLASCSRIYGSVQNVSILTATMSKPEFTQRVGIYPSIDPEQFRESLNWKVALATGSGRGIGRHIAFALTKPGASVAITGRNQKPCRWIKRRSFEILPGCESYWGYSRYLQTDQSRESIWLKRCGPIIWYPRIITDA